MKKYIKLLKFGLQAKMMLVFSIIFFILGIFFELAYNLPSYRFNTLCLGGIYLCLAGAYVYQISLTTVASNLVKSSPLRQSITTKVPLIMMTGTMMITFTTFILLRVFVVIKFFYADSSIEYQNVSYVDRIKLLYMGIITTVLIMTVLIVYYAVCFKYYLVSMILMIVFLVPIMAFPQSGSAQRMMIGVYDKLLSVFGAGCNIAVIVISYLIFFIGIGLCYLVSRLVYRKEFSPVAFRAALRQASNS